MNALEQSRLRSLSSLPLPEQSILPFRREVLKIANFCVRQPLKGLP